MDKFRKSVKEKNKKAQDKRGNMMRFAVIGTGFITEMFIEQGRLCEGFHVEAVLSRSHTNGLDFADRFNIPKSYTDIEQLAQDEKIDAVYIASPNALHKQQTMTMLNAGKHVLCEKPIASNYEELDEMLRCAQTNHKVLLEAMRLSFNPLLAELKKQMHVMGAATQAYLTFCKYSSRYDAYKQGKAPNTFEPKFSNGSLMDLGVYGISFMVEMFGVPRKIVASCSTLENGFDRSGAIIAHYSNLDVTLTYSKIATTRLKSEILFEKGAITIGTLSTLEGVEIHKDGEATLKLQADPSDMRFEIEAFMDVCHTQASIAHHHKISIETMKIIDEANRQCGIEFPNYRPEKLV